MKKRKVFDAVIVDLIEIGSLFQYLVSHWHNKRITISVWENGVRKPLRVMADYDDCDRFYRYLLKNWAECKIKVAVYEQDT